MERALYAGVMKEEKRLYNNIDNFVAFFGNAGFFQLLSIFFGVKD